MGDGERIRRHVVVHGRVQGVFFRDSTRDRAQSRGVAGWVANRSDGAVEGLVRFCRSGPSSADVDDVEVTEEPAEGLTGFSVR